MESAESVNEGGIRAGGRRTASPRRAGRIRRVSSVSRAGILALCLLSLALLFPRPAGAVPPDEYRATLVEALGLVEDGLARGGADLDLYRQAAAKLEAVHEVETADGASVAVDLGGYVAELRGETPRAAEVAAGLRSLLRALDAAPLSAADQDKAWRSLSATLARPELAPRQPGFWELLLQNLPEPVAALLREIVLAIARFVQFLGKGFASGAAGIGLVGLALLLAVFFFVLNGLRSGVLPGAALRLATAGTAPLGVAETLRLAEACAGRQDWRAAIRAQFLATLLYLTERKVLPADRSLTDGEYLRALADRPSMSDVLAALVAAFEPLWYGQRPLGAEDYRRVRDLATAVREAVPE